MKSRMVLTGGSSVSTNPGSHPGISSITLLELRFYDQEERKWSLILKEINVKVGPDPDPLVYNGP